MPDYFLLEAYLYCVGHLNGVLKTLSSDGGVEWVKTNLEPVIKHEIVRL